MERNLDQVREELAAIHDELLELPVHDFEQRSTLRERQNELRQLSHQMVEGQPLHDAKTLRTAFLRLEKVRDQLLRERLSVSGEGAGDAGIDNIFIGVVNRAIESGIGIDEIEARLAEILRQMKSSK